VSINFQTAATIAAGTYTVTLNGQAGSATASVNISATLQTNPPSFYFGVPPSLEVWVPFGGSGQIQFEALPNSQAYYNIQLSLSGLPPGTSATINPQTITPGHSTTVTITAYNTSTESENTVVTLTGTPSALVAPASIGFLLDVTPSAGQLPDNRTDYVSTEDTPFAAVYDPVHKLIFASNNSWNRVEVISASTHALRTRIPLPEPRGIDITQDDSTVWVATGSRQVFAINTSTFAVSRYVAPLGSLSVNNYWEGHQIFALADGTLMIIWTAGEGTGFFGVAIWDPVSNVLTSLTTPTYDPVEAFIICRSGDGKLVYFISGDSDGAAFYYDVQGATFSNVVALGGYAFDAAVNVDGSRVVVCDASGPNMYNGNLHIIGSVPGCGIASPPAFIQGGSVFSADNLYLYQEILADVPLIAKIDANTLNILSLAPAMPMIPVVTEMSPPYYVPIPFAVDDTGMIFGLQDWGIAFDDATYVQNYSPDQPGSPTFMQHMSPYFGPLSGGTTSEGFGNAFSLSPSVWYGATRGTATLDGSGSPSITSPPGSTPGPVNIKMLFPDGMEVFDPLFFSYGPYLQYALMSGAPSDGKVPAQIVGYGMPGDNVSGTLTIGGSSAVLGSPGANGLPFAGSPFPNKLLSYTVPSGSPGWADVTLTTPDGTSTLPKSFFYAKSVQDYSSPDTFTAVLYDSQRQQLYLSAGNHIDVFSLGSNQFITPLNPPAIGTSKQFAGLALTPDGSLLLATDLLDGSLAAISPDNPGSSYVIPIAAATNVGSGCSNGPLYVAATANNEAVVATGGFPGIACGPGGNLYLAELTTRTAGPLQESPSGSCYMSFLAYVAAPKDGTKIAIGKDDQGGFGFCIYDPIAQTYVSNGSYQTYGAAFSGDGQIAASGFVLTDSSANLIGRVARPDIYYAALGGSNNAQPDLQEPQLNVAGSLYYMAYPNFIDIVDVRHGFLRMRFSLSETVANTAVPMAIDSGGRFIYLITNQGLTVVDLGEALLSIGWLNVTAASPGSQVTVRGSGFNSTTTATVGGQAAAVTVTDENTLTLTVPSLGSGPAAIVLTNSDGTSYMAVGLLTIQ
jgi:hypothetical protein